MATASRQKLSTLDFISNCFFSRYWQSKTFQVCLSALDCVGHAEIEFFFNFLLFLFCLVVVCPKVSKASWRTGNGFHLEVDRNLLSLSLSAQGGGGQKLGEFVFIC